MVKRNSLKGRKKAVIEEEKEVSFKILKYLKHKLPDFEVKRDPGSRVFNISKTRIVYNHRKATDSKVNSILNYKMAQEIYENKDGKAEDKLSYIVHTIEGKL